MTTTPKAETGKALTETVEDVVVQEGWKLVPIEPTQEMVNEACSTAPHVIMTYTKPEERDGRIPLIPMATWRAMIAASPLPPTLGCIGATSPVPVKGVKPITLDVLRNYFKAMAAGDVPDQALALYGYLLMDGFIQKDAAKAGIPTTETATPSTKGSPDV